MAARFLACAQILFFFLRNQSTLEWQATWQQQPGLDPCTFLTTQKRNLRAAWTSSPTMKSGGIFST
ncbi:hypothetical protein K443DRAFT_240198 [Laccaria amethystina LaAM-08-1]|uniref:Secreted protein n=1 Tax=Laccaria amethystina LaAM-08-1 TaxID=1095629 RepID=A0A0C9XNL1_9AGAR|nr:hypothetical protein K443DRAFT_240198 [Laccaria amethystina LaAM-08-1]